MSSKFSVLPLVDSHYRTLVDARTHKRRVLDYVVSLGMPAVAALAIFVQRIELQGIGEIIAGVSALSALLFGLVIFVFQLRLQMTNDPRLERDSVVAELVDQLFANVAYAVLVGLIGCVVTAAAATSRVVDESGGLAPLNRYWSAVVVLVLTHLIVTILMCLKRVRSAYVQLSR